ncbi:MAG: hypothetical protein EA415_00800 [Sphaerobacteraceae bacterium]|nr:MAG: hypothetical protein EA415_00800 [Sphaerobacteraceae bacterium]
MLGDTPVVRGIWVDSDVNGFDVYLLTEPIDSHAERELLGIGPALRQRCPTVIINLRLINPDRWDVPDDDLLRVALPPGAKAIGLGAS